MHRQKFKDTLSNKVRNSQTWYREIKEENVLPKTHINANTLSNMVETEIYKRPLDLDANRSNGHSGGRQAIICDGKVIMWLPCNQNIGSRKIRTT